MKFSNINFSKFTVVLDKGGLDNIEYDIYSNQET